MKTFYKLSLGSFRPSHRYTNNLLFIICISMLRPSRPHFFLWVSVTSITDFFYHGIELTLLWKARLRCKAKTFPATIGGSLTTTVYWVGGGPLCGVYHPKLPFLTSSLKQINFLTYSPLFLSQPLPLKPPVSLNTSNSLLPLPSFSPSPLPPPLLYSVAREADISHH